MEKGLDKLFDVPLLGLLLRLLFSERFHGQLAGVFFFGGVCWLINVVVASSLLGTITFFLIGIPLALFGLWIILVLVFLVLDWLFFPAPGSGMTAKSIEREIKKGMEAGQLDLSIRYNCSQVGFAVYATCLKLEVTGGQEDDIEREIVAVLSPKTDKTIQVQPGADLWERKVYFR